jgi:preprotein translocase subunit SecE
MPNPLTNYLKQAIEELKKVVWPSKHETTQHTLIVIGLSLGVAIFLGAIDYLLNLGLQNILLGR